MRTIVTVSNGVPPAVVMGELEVLGGGVVVVTGPAWVRTLCSCVYVPIGFENVLDSIKRDWTRDGLEYECVFI